MTTILLIEDDKTVREELSKLLQKQKYMVIEYKEFEKSMLSSKIDLILLDVNLPNQNGFDICKNIKKERNIPIIFVTSCNTDEDELKSILCGGDDYVTKPYNTSILLEKIKRTIEKNNPIHYKEIEYKNVTLDLHLSYMKYQNKTIELTRNEFRIIYYFFLHPNTIISKEELIEYLWNDKYYIDENILNVNIRRLREKLEEIGLYDFIETIRKEGYKI